MDAVASLSALLDSEKGRIARLWAKRLAESQGVPAGELRETLSRHVEELARLLHERGSDAVRLWPEHVRSHGASRFLQRFEPDDVIRELIVLEGILLDRYARAHGRIAPEVALLCAQLCGEAAAAVAASYVRSVRTEEVRFREAGTMESVLHHVDVGILLAARDGAVSYVTPPVAALLGVPVRALVGARGADSLRAVLRQVRARHPNGERFRFADLPFVRALQEGKPVRGEMLVVERPSDGREVTLELSASPVIDEGTHQTMGALQTFTDRSETARKARELSDAYEELRRLQGRVLQRTRQQALGQLASSAAHALNNFLNVFKLRLALLRRDPKPEHIEALERTTQGVADLVARLQEYAMLRTAEEPAPVELRPLLEEAASSVRPELDRARVTLAVEPGPLSRVRADPTLFTELLVNIALVCKERIGEGGTLRLEPTWANGWCAVDIIRSGSPYSQEELAQLFDPLKGKSRAPQLSLLLAVGRSQVQHWGGELWCENRSDGAVFHLRLPLVETEAPAVAPVVSRPRPPPAPAARRVLVVDDDQDNARMLSEALREEGYASEAASTRGEALDRWRLGHFDVALLDAVMPETPGWDLARELRLDSPNALIAMVTGADVRGQSRATLSLVDAVFRKPVDLAALDDFLSQAQPRSEGEPVAIH